ncbi:MAG: Efflux system, outer membrane component [uncultured Sulfurovum sp.]|uniref:Efflux system, outer membrane component n=1 Tax=uncultured Sulfurovum sp. TaxID=269237 RepID=A0A6S6SAD3_9BACT|nr:MAG: Efflux system, outer membrane component [uncultured Sulfurovum sp.]
MKRISTLLLLPLFLWSEGLKDLINYAQEHNHQIKALEYGSKAKQKSLESTKSEYLMPTITVGGQFSSQSPASPFQAQDTLSGYGQIAIDLYDGGKLSAEISQKTDELQASEFDESYNKKTLALSIVNNFYNIKNQEALLQARYEEQKELEAQISRVETFHRAKLATIDQVDKIKSTYANNSYQITANKQNIFELKKSLSLKLGREVSSLENASIIEPRSNPTEELNDNIKSLDASASALVSTASSLDAAYRPQVQLSDTYNVYEYYREDSNPLVESPNHQNTLMLNVNMQLFDNGAIKKQKQSLMIQHQAMQEQINQAKDEQDNNRAIAFTQIKTAKEKIHSATLALEASDSVYHMIEQKFEAKIVDNVTYLDALSNKTAATAQYEIALNSLEVAKANCYFQLGLNVEEYINE